MNTISLNSSLYSGATLVSDFFIDNYMADANEAQIKIYLYLLRCSGSNTPVSVSSIADHFNYTEKDTLRALLYWDRQGLISLGYDGNNNITGICINGFTERNTHPEPAPVTEFVQPASQPAPDTVNFSYSPDKLHEFRSREEVKQLIFMTEHYMGKTLSGSDLNALLYMYDNLRFPLDLVEYLIEYCVNNNHKSMRYIEKTALSWANAGIRTVKEAKENNSRYKKEYFAVLKAYGISGRNPVESDIDYIKRWRNEYGFDLEIIIEACSRTMKSIAKPSFAYTDTILKSWKDKNIHHLSDLGDLDREFHKSQATTAANKTPVVPKPNRFKNFKEHDCDFDELAMRLIRN